MTYRYVLITYDVLGDENKGFEINSAHINTFLESEKPISEMTDKEALALVEADETIEIDQSAWSEERIEFRVKNSGKPREHWSIQNITNKTGLFLIDLEIILC